MSVSELVLENREYLGQTYYAASAFTERLSTLPRILDAIATLHDYAASQGSGTLILSARPSERMISLHGDDLEKQMGALETILETVLTKDEKQRDNIDGAIILDQEQVDGIGYLLEPGIKSYFTDILNRPETTDLRDIGYTRSHGSKHPIALVASYRLRQTAGADSYAIAWSCNGEIRVHHDGHIIFGPDERELKETYRIRHERDTVVPFRQPLKGDTPPPTQPASALPNHYENVLAFHRPASPGRTMRA